VPQVRVLPSDANLGLYEAQNPG